MSFLDKEKNRIIKAATDYITKKMFNGGQLQNDSECFDELNLLLEALADYKLKTIEEFEKGIEDSHKGIKPQRNNEFYMKGYKVSIKTLEELQKILQKGL